MPVNASGGSAKNDKDPDIPGKKEEPTEDGNKGDNEMTPRPSSKVESRNDATTRPNSDGGNQDSRGRLRERYILREGELEEINDEDFFDTLVPCGIRKLPKPQHIPNGLLAAINLVPFADDIRSGDQFFEGLGVTLVTNDARGTPINYHGDATVRLSQPPPGVIIEVPKEEKVNEMREILFRMNKPTQEETQRKSDRNKPDFDEQCGCGMTKAELEAITGGKGWFTEPGNCK